MVKIYYRGFIYMIFNKGQASGTRWSEMTEEWKSYDDDDNDDWDYGDDDEE